MGGCQQYAPCALAEHVLETSVGSLKGWSEKWGRGACKQVRLWEAKDAARWAGEGAEAPSKGLSWTCRLWPLDSVDFSPPSLSESCSGSSAAAGTSDAEVAEWPQAAGCG